MAYKIRGISLPRDVMDMADKEAKRLGVSFSAFLRLLISQYFNDITFERKHHDAEKTKEV